MTSSEPSPAPPPLAAPSPATEPLLQGHLHPAILLLRLIEALRSALFPLVAGVLVNRWFLALAAATLLMQLGYALVRYLTFHYTLTRTELRLREGILERQERRIPIDRIQDLGFESTILRRMLGLAVVSVETASGKGAEAVLDSLGRAEAEELREALLRERQARLAHVAQPLTPPEALVPPAPEPEWTVATASSGDLLMRGLTDLRVGALLVSAFAALQIADQLGLLVKLRFDADSFFAWLHGFPLALVAVVLVALVAGALTLSAIASAVGNVMAFHGFTLSLRGDTLLARYGLFTRRQKTLPRSRVQRVTVEQAWLRRLLGSAVVSADSAGSGRGAGEMQASGFDVVVPMAPLAAVESMLPALLPQVRGLPSDYLRGSARLVLRTSLKGAIWGALITLASWPFVGPFAALALLLVPVAWTAGQLAYGNLGYQIDEHHLFLRFGIVGRYQAILPTAKVQAVVQERGPLQQLLGLTDLTVFVAGGSPTRLADLTVEVARALQRELALRGARAAAQDWARKNLLPQAGGGA